MQGWIPFGDMRLDVEYELAPHMVIFSHGFGVRRDSRGLFTDIVAALPRGTGYVLFDYDDFDAAHNLIHINGFDDDVRRLRAILEWTRQQNGVSTVSLVGHSLGSLVIADLAPPNIDTILLLAPPTTQLGGYRRRRYTQRPGAEQVRGVWRIPRRQGATLLISEAIFDELEHIDPEGELVKLALLRTFTLVIAEADEVLVDDDYTELMVMDNITSLGVEGADHLFSGFARPQLVELVTKQLAHQPVADE